MSDVFNKANALDRASPVNLETKIGTKLVEIDTYGGGLAVLKHRIEADYTGGVNAIQCPFACEIIDVVVQCRAANASGTVTARAGTNAVTDAIVCATDDAKVAAGSIAEAYSTFAKDAYINLITNGAADRGDVFVFVQKQ